jgi:hypothetical protein
MPSRLGSADWQIGHRLFSVNDQESTGTVRFLPKLRGSYSRCGTTENRNQSERLRAVGHESVGRGFDPGPRRAVFGGIRLGSGGMSRLLGSAWIMSIVHEIPGRFGSGGVARLKDEAWRDAR